MRNGYDLLSFISKHDNLDNTRNNKIPETSKFWFSLDNAAKIFPAIITDEVTSVFRLSAVLKHAVRIAALRKAVLLAEERYPFFRVRLKEGFFWYYLEHLPLHIPIEPDSGLICRKFPKGNLLIRILVRNNTVNFEFSHILTDGGGAFEFFKTVLILYSGECGVEIPPEYRFRDPGNLVSEEEYEDAYKRYFKDDIPPMVKRSKAFHIPFPLKPLPRFTRQIAMVSSNQVKQIANEKGVSITAYFAAVYLYTLQEIFEDPATGNLFKRKKWLRIQIPVDLRKILPSKTMRNFSLFVMPEIDMRLGHYSFDEILKVVHHQMMLESDEKLIHKNIARNVGSEKKIYVRGIPLLLKSFILRLKFYSLGTSQYSGVISNMGKITLPGDTTWPIDYFSIIAPPPNKMLKINCGIVGFGDKLALTFGNITNSNAFEEKFLRFLKQQNISVELKTNP